MSAIDGMARGATGPLNARGEVLSADPRFWPFMSAIFRPIYVLFAIDWVKFRSKMSFSALYLGLSRGFGARGRAAFGGKKSNRDTKFRAVSAWIVIPKPSAIRSSNNLSLFTDRSCTPQTGVIHILLRFEPPFRGSGYVLP